MTLLLIIIDIVAVLAAFDFVLASEKFKLSRHFYNFATLGWKEKNGPWKIN